MKKTADLLNTNIALVDLSVVVLDSRVPLSSLNPLVEKIICRKPVLYLLNKADLADESQTRLWAAWLKGKKNGNVIICSAVQPAESVRITNACFSLCPEAKTGRRGVRVLITGIPNAGKSTLINTLCGESKAKTGDRPAVTTKLQKILTRGGLDLYDTPGILWHKFEDQTAACRLAATGAIREEILNLPDIALFSIGFLRQYYGKALADRFSLGDVVSEDPVAVLETVARKRGCIGKGGAVDWDKAAAVFLREMRAGKLGRLTFDRWEEFAATEAVRTAGEAAAENGNADSGSLSGGGTVQTKPAAGNGASDGV